MGEVGETRSEERRGLTTVGGSLSYIELSGPSGSSSSYIIGESRFTCNADLY